MSARALLESLLDPEAVTDEALLPVALLARSGRRRALDRQSDLAHGEWQDGLHADEAEARRLSQEEAPALALAAAPESAPPTLTFEGGGWTLRWGTRPDGGATVLLLGPGPAELLVAGALVPLAPRAWTAIALPLPPSELLLRLADGSVVVLRR